MKCLIMKLCNRIGSSLIPSFHNISKSLSFFIKKEMYRTQIKQFAKAYTLWNFVINEEVCKISPDMCHQIREKVINDILDYIIQAVHHNMKYFKQIFQKNSIHAFAKEIETFCIYIAVKVFLKTPTKSICNK